MKKELNPAELDFLLRFPFKAGVVSPVDFLQHQGWGGIKVRARPLPAGAAAMLGGPRRPRCGPGALGCLPVHGAAAFPPESHGPRPYVPEQAPAHREQSPRGPGAVRRVRATPGHTQGPSMSRLKGPEESSPWGDAGPFQNLSLDPRPPPTPVPLPLPGPGSSPGAPGSSRGMQGKSQMGCLPQALSEMDEFKNLDNDIEGSAKRWKKLVESEAPEKEIFPKEWKTKTALQKLCMVRCMRPDRMTYAVR